MTDQGRWCFLPGGIFNPVVFSNSVHPVGPAHQVDDIDEVHELDPVHQVDHKDEFYFFISYFL